MSDSGGGLGRIGVVVAARTGSTRLPGKALLQIGGLPMILFLMNRLAGITREHMILLATTDLPEDDNLTSVVQRAGYEVFRGASEDVIQRYVKAASHYKFDTIVRVTGDCPFVESKSLNYCLDYLDLNLPFDLGTTKGLFPKGIDYEIYPSYLIKEIHETRVLSEDDREHLTLYLYKNRDKYKIISIPSPFVEQANPISFTVDTLDDYEFSLKILNELDKNKYDIDEFLKQNAL